jgi:hypothetical protein
MPPVRRAADRCGEEARAAIEAFLASARQPALLEPGEELLPLGEGSFALELRGTRLTLQAWDRTRNLTRRVTGVGVASAGRLEMVVEHFARREGRMYLLDLARPSGAEMGRRSGRLVFRERFRLFLRRQFPEWTLAELSTEPNLEHSLSPTFPRAFLRHGQHGWAAIACPEGGDAAGVVSFGLIWLAYLRHREQRVTVEGLAIYLPQGHERAAALRALCLNPSAARYELFRYSGEDFVSPVDPRDHGNLDTHLEPFRRPSPDAATRWQSLAALPGIEQVLKTGGRTSLRVRGVEFAEIDGDDLRFGLGRQHSAGADDIEQIERVVAELAHARSPEAPDRDHPLYRQYPEAWLESQARAHLQVLDATLRPEPVYGQVPAFAGGERGILDLLAVDHAGRLTVVELKASADLHLPVQALDYWIRVKWHLDRGEFGPAGYFPGIELDPKPPRLLLVAPSLEFHPSTETILEFFSPLIDVERVGIGVEWRKGLQVMFRLAGCERPR